jgi:hypothetical protein
MTLDNETEAAKHAKNLTLALGILDSYWDRFSENMSPEERAMLTSELTDLEPRIRNSTNITETSEQAVRFFNVCSKIEPLAFLSDMDDSLNRGATLPAPDEEVKIKILNYCVTLKEKLDE